MSASNSPWPPAYSVRKSGRARRVSLRVTPEKGLELVLPADTDENMIPFVLERYKVWILRHLAKAEALNLHRAALQGGAYGSDSSGLPDNTREPSFFIMHGGILRIDIEWVRAGMGAESPAELITRAAKAAESAGIFAYNAIAATETRVLPATRVIWKMARLSRSINQERLCLCVKAYAHMFLGETLRRSAERYALGYKNLRLAAQKSRWGSYSARGTINLNSKLVFLPPELSNYILLHELCHSRFLNHGREYWNLVCSLDPAARKRDRDMRGALVWVPAWFA